MRLLVIRHGETVSSRLGHFTGRADVALSERGREQAGQWREALTDFCRGEEVSVASSPLSRCIETSTAAGMTADVWPDLVEWDLGVLDGLSADDHRRAHPEWNLFVDGPPKNSGERVHEVRERAERVLARVTERGADAVLFTHGQFAKVLVGVVLSLPAEASSRFALGPARGVLFLDRVQGKSLAGWNIAPSPERLWNGLS
ncbi:histidine phosphatase family protein [Microbacterium sp.]|uniref:histidine phosphatase family protein n=1 Tax=Microbacterium sp. TaxID=51671 RepID=UPI0033428E00